MNNLSFNTLSEAEEYLISEYGVRTDSILELLEATDFATDELIAEYENEGLFDEDVVKRTVKIGLIEFVVEMDKNNIHDDIEDEIKSLTKSLKEKPVSNISPIVGKKSTANRDMVMFSNIILEEHYSME